MTAFTSQICCTHTRNSFASVRISHRDQAFAHMHIWRLEDRDQRVCMSAHATECGKGLTLHASQVYLIVGRNSSCRVKAECVREHVIHSAFTIVLAANEAQGCQQQSPCSDCTETTPTYTAVWASIFPNGEAAASLAKLTFPTPLFRQRCEE